MLTEANHSQKRDENMDHLRLHVTMDDPVAVQVVQGADQLLRNVTDNLLGQRLVMLQYFKQLPCTHVRCPALTPCRDAASLSVQVCGGLHVFQTRRTKQRSRRNCHRTRIEAGRRHYCNLKAALPIVLPVKAAAVVPPWYCCQGFKLRLEILVVPCFHVPCVGTSCSDGALLTLRELSNDNEVVCRLNCVHPADDVLMLQVRQYVDLLAQCNLILLALSMLGDCFDGHSLPCVLPPATIHLHTWQGRFKRCAMQRKMLCQSLCQSSADCELVS